MNIVSHDAKMCIELDRTDRKNIKKRNLGAKDWKNKLRGKYSRKRCIRGEKDEPDYSVRNEKCELLSIYNCNKVPKNNGTIQ